VCTGHDNAISPPISTCVPHDHAKFGEVGADLIELKGVAIAVVQSGIEIGSDVEKDWKVVKHAQLVKWIAHSVMREESDRSMYFETLDSPFLDGKLEVVEGATPSWIDSVKRNQPVRISVPSIDDETIFFIDGEWSIPAASRKVSD
jgi:hypothetical protein